MCFFDKEISATWSTINHNSKTSGLLKKPIRPRMILVLFWSFCAMLRSWIWGEAKFEKGILVSILYYRTHTLLLKLRIIWPTIPHPPLCLSWHNNNTCTRTANWKFWFWCPIPHYLIVRILQRLWLWIPSIPVEYLLHRPLLECTASNTTPWNCTPPQRPLPPECRCTSSTFQHLWKPRHCPWKCLAPTSPSLWIPRHRFIDPSSRRLPPRRGRVWILWRQITKLFEPSHRGG